MKDRWNVMCADELEAVIPGFDPYRLGRVTSVRIDFDTDESGTDVSTAVIRAVYWSPNPIEMLVELTFNGIRQMVLPELGSVRFEFSELHVVDISERGLEGIRREVTDHGMGGQFHILCGEVRGTGVFSRDGDSLSQLWPRDQK